MTITYVMPKPMQPSRDQIRGRLVEHLAALERQAFNFGCERGSPLYFDRMAYEIALAAIDAGETYGLPRLNFHTAD